MKKIYILIIITILSFGLIGCVKNPDKGPKINYYLLDETFGGLTLQVYAIATKELIDNYPNLETELSSITNELDELYSASNINSLLSQINKNAGIAPVAVNQELIDIIKAAKYVSKLSEVDNVALYDVSILPLSNLWDINNLRYNKKFTYAEAPKEAEIQELLPLIDYKKIIIDEENQTMFLQDVGMKIELGSILKGYAADKLKAHLNSIGIENGLINVAGNLYAMGQNYLRGNFTDWEIDIQTPYKTKFDGDDLLTFGTIIGYDVTAVTSGSYERYILTSDDIQYHHILDPRTGYPNDSDILSVTIVTKDSMLADALSTATFCLGLEKGYELIENIEGTEAVFLTNSKLVYVTSGLKDKFIFNEAVTEIDYVYKGVKNGTSN